MIEAGYRIDLLVEDLVVVEVKAIEKVLPVHHAQLLSYLKLSDKRVGLLINFHVEHLKDGIVRLANKACSLLPRILSLFPLSFLCLSSAYLRVLCG